MQRAKRKKQKPLAIPSGNVDLGRDWGFESPLGQ